MIDVEGLAAFVAIAEQRSFSRAADQLGVAQSVVSKRLKRLEDQLGARLIDRAVRSKVQVTRTGEGYLDEARATLGQLHKAERIGRNLARGLTGPLRVGYIFSAAMNGTLKAVLHVLSRALPALSLDVQMMETPEQLAALDEGRLDVALVRPRLSFPPVCTIRAVHAEPLVVGLPRDHPFVGLRAVGVSALGGQRFIIPQFREQVGLAENLRRLCEAGGFTAVDTVRTADFVTAAVLAASGHGVVLAPASLANIGLSGLEFREIADFSDRIETVLLCRKDAPPRALEAIAAINWG